MKLKKKYRNGIILLLFIVLSVVMLLTINSVFDTGSLSSKKTERFTSIGVGEGYESWTSGEWNIFPTFNAVGSDVVVAEDGLSATASSSGTLESNAIELTYSVGYVGGSYDGSINPYDISVVVPLYVYNTSDDYSYEYNEDNNSMDFYNSYGDYVGYINFGDMLYCPEDDDGTCSSSASTLYAQFFNGGLTVFNVSSYEGSEDINYTFTLEYSFVGSELTANMEYLIESYVYIKAEDFVTLELLLTDVINNSSSEDIDLSGIGIFDEEYVYTRWESEYWGEPDTIPIYDYYVEYFIDGPLDLSDTYSYKYIIEETNGVLLAHSYDWEEYSYVGEEDFNTSNLCSMSSTTGENYLSCLIVVGYNLDGLSYMDANLKLRLEVTSGVSSGTGLYEWNTFLEEPGEVEYPIGTNKGFIQTLVSDDAGIGALDVIKNNNMVLFDWKIEPTTSSMNSTSSGNVKAFNLWDLTEQGTIPYTLDIETTGGYIDSSYNSVVNPLALNSDEYIYDSFYLIDDIEYDYELNDNGNAYNLVESDLNTYSDKSVYVKIEDGEYELIGSISKTANGTINYVASDDRTTNNADVSVDNPVVLPSNVTDIKITYVGTKAAVYIGVGYSSMLMSSDNLLDKFTELETSNVVLKNEAKLSVASTLESTKLTGTYLTAAYESSTSYGTDHVVNDVYTDSDGIKYDSITYTDYVFEQLNYSTDVDSAKEFITEQNNVTVYQLLPAGAILDGDVKAYTYGNLVAVTTNVTSTDNYNGSGRTLLEIDITLSDGVTNIYEGNGYLQTGFKLEYDILYSYASNQNYGTTLYKDMAYYSNGNLTEGVANASLANSSSFSSSSAQNTLATLNTSNEMNNAVFTTETVTVDKVTVTEGDYIKQTKNSSDTTYGISTDVMESKKYSYRLQYVFASDYEEIENLVFVDKLESSYSNNQYFKGTLDSVDTSYLNSIGVTTEIYYSTNPNVDLENIDLTDTSSWSTTKPTTDIVAIAISCGSYLFKGSDNVAPMVDITMIAPNEYAESKMAYNESFINYNYLGETNVRKVTSDITTVELLKAPITINATTSVGESTETNPGVVENSFEYIIDLSNTGSEELENISYELVLPLGLTIDTSLISEVSTDTNGVFGTYSYDSTNRVLTYNVTKLLGGENKTVTVPVGISYNDLNNVTSFSATVELIKLGNIDYDSEIITLYNKLAVPELTYQKYVDTADTDGYTDEATVIIEKGETYSYRVNVNNISDINATNIEVVDTVPSGLIVVESSITNGGVYDSANGTIIWNFNLNAKNNINLEYNVTVPDDITLGTNYRASAHITVINPIDNSLKLYDDDTNIVGTLYQIVSNLKVTNELIGNLADKEKEFKYTFEFSGDASYAGTYGVVDASNNNVGTLTLDGTGKGTYTASLKAGESIEFKLLPNGITYSIKQDVEEGYQTIATDGNLDGNNVVITGITAEEKQINYTYTNSYSVSTSVDVSGEITYDKEFTSNMFALNITDNNGYTDTKYADKFGVVNFDTLEFIDVEGTYTYTVSQINTNVNKVLYDVITYNVVVKLTNDGKGNLDSEVKYYNKFNQEVSEIIFNNEYLPNGLIIQNVNTSDYVDTTKEFKYVLEITNGIAGTYVVNDKNGNKISDLVIDDNGYGMYEFTLFSDEKIVVLDLPANTEYIVIQEMVDYYTVEISGLSYALDTENKLILYSGITNDNNFQIIFNNNYVTSGEFTPSSAIVLLEKELELDEFSFMIKDVSTGITNGYEEIVTNDIDGNLEFSTIEYTRPGTYVYEITQIKGDSNHIYYDLSKCLLTVKLIDNGDSTMTVESSLYEYENGKEYFENTYSVEPIVPEYVAPDKNPNTVEGISKFGIVIIMFAMVVGLFLVEKNVRKRRLSV